MSREREDKVRKLKELNWYYVMGVVYIAAITALAAADVGKVPVCSQEPYTLSVPLAALLFLIIPFALGALGGARDD